METVSSVKRSIYRPPFALKKVRKFIYKPYRNCNGKVKVYTQEEIEEYLKEKQTPEEASNRCVEHMTKLNEENFNEL